MNGRPASVHVLLIDDSRGDRRLIREFLAEKGGAAYALLEAATLAEGTALLAQGGVDVVLLDLGLPDSLGLETLSAVRRAAPAVPVIVFTGTDSEETAIAALQAGAQDYLVKNRLNAQAIVRILRYALERARFERSLRASEEKFRTMADYAASWESLLDADLRYQYVTPACERITGYPPEEFLADPDLAVRIVHPDDRGAFLALRRDGSLRVAPGGGAREAEFRIVTRSGALRWIGHTSHPIFAADGTLRGWRISNHDITERREAAAILQRNKARLESLLRVSRSETRTTPDLLALALQEALSLTGSLYGCLYLSADGAGPLRTLARGPDPSDGSPATAQPTTGSPELQGVCRDAVRRRRAVVANAATAPASPLSGPSSETPRALRWVAVPVIVRDQVQAVLGAGGKPGDYDETDIQQLELFLDAVWRIKAEREAIEEVRSLNVELEQRVAERTRALAEANRELESFSYSVSHDLRAPLRSIDGFSQALLDDCADSLNAEGRDYLQRIRTASHRMADLIDDLLQLSRVSRQELRLDTVDLTRMTDEIIGELRREAPERAVTVRIEPGMRATADPHLLGIALRNLLSNAWKFTGRVPAAQIDVGTAVRAGRREFWVRDNGAGFDPDYAERLFTPFQRLHSAAHFSGTGIGLTIVRRILRRHGGDIRAEGRPDDGALFTFFLPEAP